MYVTRSIPDLTKMGIYDAKPEPPDSVLKIYIADQSHKLIFARKVISASKKISRFNKLAKLLLLGNNR